MKDELSGDWARNDIAILCVHVEFGAIRNPLVCAQRDHERKCDHADHGNNADSSVEIGWVHGDRSICITVELTEFCISKPYDYNTPNLICTPFYSFLLALTIVTIPARTALSSDG